jgi:PIN domain nuclease of toxin-antitoxin system
VDIKGGLLLDTHVWFWFQSGNSQRLSQTFVRQLESRQRAGELFVSACSAWEIANLVAKQRITLDRSVEHWIESGLEDGGLRLLPLTTRILIESTRLPGEIHRDPADRMIVATAREHNLTLLSRDESILAYAADGHVKARSPK